MASSRKKQDEKNLKTLRDLGSLPQNKYCFDCNQRGPTYVNVTIGSFVCTKCSGMLRGLTPPHRVKSISMATFTTDEIDLLRNRGNDYCRRVWLGLYEGTLQSHTADEQSIKDFMVDKYERKRYYLDPGMTSKTEVSNIISPNNQLVSNPKPIKLNGFNGPIHSVNGMPSRSSMQNSHRSRPEVKNNVNNVNSFAVNFEKADIFSSSNGNNNMQNSIHQNGFANFDNNPVFSSTNSVATSSSTGLPAAPTINDSWNNQQNNVNSTLNNTTSLAPSNDKYAALKDLDNEMKSQTIVDWSSSGSNGSLYSTPTPTGSIYSSPSPQGSNFGSPSQSQFLSAFPPAQENGATVSNPFSNGSVNWNTNGINSSNGMNSSSSIQNQHPYFANPFREQPKVNGFSNTFQPFPSNAVPVNGMTNGWVGNPFKISNVTNTTSNNPFL